MTAQESNANFRIMIVDDEFDILKMVRLFLERWGYQVETFSNPRYALEQFKKNPHNYSLALLDIRMPEMSGITLATSMRKIRADMKIAIMTAYEVAPDELSINLPTIKRQDIVKKPFKLQQICEAVKKQLQAA